MGFFLIIEFTFMSKTLYMTVCSKNVLFSVCRSKEQLSKPLLNGIFSCTEPPRAIIDIKRSRRRNKRGRERDDEVVRGGIDMRVYSVQCMIGHADILLECWMDRVYGKILK